MAACPGPAPSVLGYLTSQNAATQGRVTIFELLRRKRQAVSGRLRHQPRRPALSRSRPGNPAPAMGPGTASIGASPQKPATPFMNGVLGDAATKVAAPVAGSMS